MGLPKSWKWFVDKVHVAVVLIGYVNMRAWPQKNTIKFPSYLRAISNILSANRNALLASSPQVGG